MVDWDLAVRIGVRLAGEGPTIGPRRGRGDRRGAPRRRGPLDRAGPRVHRAGRAATTRPRCWSSTGPAGCRRTPTRSRPCSRRSSTSSPRRSRRPGSPPRSAPRITGAEVGGVLGFLASKVLGQFDPFHDPDGRLLLVAPNIVHVERELEADPHDFRLWVCLHEETHRVQFTAVPWMREHLFGADPEVRRDHGAVAACSRTASPGSSRGSRTPAPAARRRQPPRRGRHPGAEGAARRPDRRDVAARGPRRRGHGRRRPDRDPVGRQDPRQVQRAPQGRRRARPAPAPGARPRRQDGAVPRRRRRSSAPSSTRPGCRGFNVVWEQPEHLPTRAEIADPDAWMARVLHVTLARDGEPPPVRRRGPGRRTPDPGRARRRAARPGCRRTRPCWSPAPADRTRWRCCRRRSSRGTSSGCRVIGVTVDHGLQEDSAAHADRVVEQMAGARRRRDRVGAGRGARAAVAGRRRRPARRGTPSSTRWSQHFGAVAVLLGHTLDDQAETVLLGLARGSGGRSLAGMRRRFDHYRRPLLDVTRTDTVTACQVEGIEYWNDPHNIDPAYARVRVRRKVLPVLEDELGPGVAGALARTADQLRADMELLDQLAAGGVRRAARRRRRAGGQGARRPAAGHPLTGCSGWPPSTPGRPAPSCSTCTSSRWASCCASRGAGGEVQLPGHVTAYLSSGGRGRAAAVPADRCARLTAMDAADVESDLVEVLFTEAQIQERLGELAREIEADYDGQGPADRRHPARRGDGDGRPGAVVLPARRDGLDGDLVVRLRHQVQRRGADPQGPRHRHLRPAT